MQESARGVLLTPTGHVLLMKVAATGHPLWITPGGRIQAGEDAAVAALREVREETGREGLRITAEVWVRHGTCTSGGSQRPERERFFLMPTARFAPTSVGMEREEFQRHMAFRWWAIGEIARSEERFVPGNLADLLRTLVAHGPTPAPIESGE